MAHLVNLLQQNERHIPYHLRVLDLCAGSGCIAFLFRQLWSQKLLKPTLDIAGVDIDPKALALSGENQKIMAQRRSGAAPKEIDFIQADILNDTSSTNIPPLLPYLREKKHRFWDVIISNPPYISPKQFYKTTARSVRKFEPRLALVPGLSGPQLPDDEQADLFYPRLSYIANQVGAKVLLMEVGDLDQAKRVAKLVKTSGVWDGVEIWRDEPGALDGDDGMVDGVLIKGRGNVRSVMCWKEEGCSWLGR